MLEIGFRYRLDAIEVAAEVIRGIILIIIVLSRGRREREGCNGGA